jgi:hypothetical protein
VLENLGELPPRLVVGQIRIPPEVSREVLAAADLPGCDGPQPNAMEAQGCADPAATVVQQRSCGG